MNYEDWLVTSGLAALIYITKRTIEHGFNRTLARLEADLKNANDRLNSEIRARETAVATLSTSAITALSARQQAMHERRTAAVDTIWTAVLALAPARNLSAMMTGVRFQETVKESKINPAVRKFAEDVMEVAGPMSPKAELNAASRARPFVSVSAWATYSAYASICTLAYARWSAIHHGLGTDEILNNDRVAELIRAAMPSFGGFIDAHGPESFHYVLESLEAKLLQDLNHMLSGVEDDAAAVEQAATTLRAAELVAAQGRATSRAVQESADGDGG